MTGNSEVTKAVSPTALATSSNVSIVTNVWPLRTSAIAVRGDPQAVEMYKGSKLAWVPVPPLLLRHHRTLRNGVPAVDLNMSAPCVTGEHRHKAFSALLSTRCITDGSTLQQLTTVHVCAAEAGELVAHNVCSGESRKSRGAKCTMRAACEFECHCCTGVVRTRRPELRERMAFIVVTVGLSGGFHCVVLRAEEQVQSKVLKAETLFAVGVGADALDCSIKARFRLSQLDFILVHVS
eukprot:7390985-Prymnesium_polylepis.1